MERRRRRHMPAKSRNQAIAARIAHAVEKGEKPKSSLRGPSKKMYRAMKGTGELRKFAATKTKGLPKHVKEGRDDTGKLGLGKAGESYARMTSKDVMHQPGGVADKVRKRYAMAKDVTNQNSLSGGKPQSTVFPSMDKAGKVPSAIKDSRIPHMIVARLLDD